MKKLIAIFALIALVGGVSAQSQCCFETISASKKSSDNRFHLGLKAGPNFTSIRGSESHPSRAKFMWHAGIFGEKYFSQRVGMSFEAVYSVQGFNGPRVNGKQPQYNYKYLNVPVMINLALSDSRKVVLKTGLQAGFSLGGKERFVGSGRKHSLAYEKRPRFDLSIPVSIEYNFIPKMYLDLRYNLSTLKVVKGSQNDKRYNSNVSLSLGWRMF